MQSGGVCVPDLQCYPEFNFISLEAANCVCSPSEENLQDLRYRSWIFLFFSTEKGALMCELECLAGGGDASLNDVPVLREQRRAKKLIPE
ncbi:hypothetical protein CEXT_117401 [Caerostris extrusa]|uniref:Uncharacterized protein n=1 Tax=Caerostris extrusa TaxID=172846 RepID=A0AAV4P928_CAEEX|nr:hypothetical protein CEXT_117401 [Caerostris extrusa]